MIINRYLMREISKPLIAVLSVLIILFASYSAAGFLSDAVNGLLASGTLAELTGLKVLISLEVLIPISLYLSVVLALGRLYSESELTAMLALCVSPKRIMGVVLILAGLLAVLVAALSLEARPWAYQQSHEISKQAQALINFDDMQAGAFYEVGQGSRVIFIGKRKGPGAPAKDVFIQLKRAHKILIVHARRARQQKNTDPGREAQINLSAARIYKIGHKNDPEDRVSYAPHMILNLTRPKERPPGYSALAASTAKLAASDSPEDVAEFQWRLSTPLSTLLLAMLGVPLARARPRQGRYAKMGAAILVYSAYYLLYTSARNWVKGGTVGAFPGIWWAPALLALVLAAALIWPNLNIRNKVTQGASTR